MQQGIRRLCNGGELGKGTVLFAALSGIIAVILGVLVYREKAGSYQFIGMVLGITAMETIPEQGQTAVFLDS